jgi:hypothetical protein
MVEMRNACNIIVGKLEGKRHLGRPGSRWNGNLDQILGKVWTGFIWLRIGTSGRLL